MGVVVTMVMMHVGRPKVGAAKQAHALAVDKHVGYDSYVVDAVQRRGGVDDFEQIEQGQADALFARQQSPAMRGCIHIFGHKLRLAELMGQHHVRREALGHKPIPALVAALDEIGEGQLMVFHGGDRVLDQHLMPEDQLAGMARCACALESHNGRATMVRLRECRSLRQGAVDGCHRRPGVARGSRQRCQSGMAG